MEFAIYHEHGLVTEMKWCPQACYDDPSETDGLPRLGLLAVACSDSCLRIYKVPQPNFMPKITTDFPVYQTFPPIILNPLFGEPCTHSAGKSMATCIEWQNDGQKVAAGYGNGSICVWMVKTSSTISKEDEDLFSTLQPYLYFKAGNTPVTSLTFAPLESGRFLVCTSLEESVKYFDLFDPCMPFFTLKQGFARNCWWETNSCVVCASLIDGVVGSDFAKDCRTEKFTPLDISGSAFSSLTYAAFSDINNAHAIADMNGTVLLNRLYDEKGQPSFDDTYLIFNTEIVTLDRLENEMPKEADEIIEIVTQNGDENSSVVSMEKCVSYCERSAPCFALGKENNSDSEELINFSHLFVTDDADSDNLINDKHMCVSSSEKTRIESDIGENDNMVDLPISPCASLSGDNLKENQPFWIRNFLSSKLSEKSEDKTYNRVQSKRFSPLHNSLIKTLYKNCGDSHRDCNNSEEGTIDIASNSSLDEITFDKHSLVAESCSSFQIDSDTDYSCAAPEIMTVMDDTLPLEESCNSDSFEHSGNRISNSPAAESCSSFQIDSDTDYSCVTPEMTVNSSDDDTLLMEESHISDSFERSRNRKSNSLVTESCSSFQIDSGTDYSCATPERTVNSSDDTLLLEESFNSDSFEYSRNKISAAFESSEADISEYAESLVVTERVNNFPPYLPLSIAFEAETFDQSKHSRTIKPCFQASNKEKNSKDVCDILEEKIVNLNNIEKEDNLIHKNPSYSSLTAKYGLIFQNTNSNPTVTSNNEKKDSFPSDYKHLSAINTLSWNPNHGCHFWLFAAGSSGVARLTCVSELITEENISP